MPLSLCTPLVVIGSETIKSEMRWLGRRAARRGIAVGGVGDEGRQEGIVKTLWKCPGVCVGSL